MSGRNHEVTNIQKLLNSGGSLREPGWSRTLCQIYDRNDIKAPSFRIKEWDYYLVLSEKFAVALTVSDDGYIGLQSASLLLFGEKPWEHTETVLNFFPMGKLKMPSDTASGDVCYSDKRLSVSFVKTPGKRRLICEFKKFFNQKPFSCDITLDEPDMDSLVIATPWKNNPKAFYYNSKTNCMRASGKAFFDGAEYIFNPETDFAVLDWGRGVWTYNNRWYWSSGSGLVNGRPFGFNLGYGFGCTEAASENIIFYDGVGHKTDDVEFIIPRDANGRKDYMKKWKITSSDARFEADFVPVLDRAAKLDIKLISTDQHQVFGRMSGRAVLDSGEALEFKNLLCFAEDVHNKY